MSRTPLNPAPYKDLLASQDHVAQSLWVGVIGISLPIYMLVIVKLGVACPHTSLSHFYYSKYGGTIFVGALVFIGSTLLFYRSDKNESPRETRATNFAGLMALIVAFVPTTEGGCVTEGGFPMQVFADVTVRKEANGTAIAGIGTDTVSAFNASAVLQAVHLLAAGLMLAFLAVYAARVFTRIQEHQIGDNRKPTLVKRARNAIYYASALVIFLCIARIGLHALTVKPGSFEHQMWNAEQQTFWHEAYALWAFSFAWLVKGRFFSFLKDR